MMPWPFPNSILRDKVFHNVQFLESEGETRNAAIRQAFNQARQVFFTRYPTGALPAWLADKGRRLQKYYLDTGAPLRDNPVPQSTVLKARRLYSGFTGHASDNAVKVGAPCSSVFRVGLIVGRVLAFELAPEGSDEVYRLEFTGADRPVMAVSYDGKKAVFIDGDFSPVSPYVDKLRISRIMYETVRDGRLENYQHPFRTTARPLLATLDGRNACMRGGAFKFTDRGYVDQR